VALADGYRESTESWADALRSLKDRGLSAPVLAVGDGALGFWAALRDIFPEIREQRCWVHVTANCLDALPKRLHADAKDAIAKIYSASSRAAALEAVKTFSDEFSAFPKAVKKITGQLDVLLAFYDFPLEHWIHLRTTNPVESTFSTVRLRTKVTRGAGSRKAGLAMAYKLLDAAQDRWRRINGHELVPLVRASATSIDGKLQERSVTTDSDSSTGSVAA
jgi:transposase-like protein